LLILIYNATIDLHYTPLLWRDSKVVFLPKPGKEDYTDRRAFRPILLMLFFFKALERLVQWRMDATALPLDKEQHAFRKGHCTEQRGRYTMSQDRDNFKSFKTWFSA
jgi:hypothetical protein